MGKETIEKEINKIPFEKRNIFQYLLIQSLLGEKPVEKTDEDWSKEALKLVEKYAKTVSDIIDNPKNKNIKDLIMSEKYKEAIEIVVGMLEKIDMQIVMEKTA